MPGVNDVVPSIHRFVADVFGRDVPVHRALFRPAHWALEQARLQRAGACWLAVALMCNDDLQGELTGYSVWSDTPFRDELIGEAFAPATNLTHCLMDVAATMCRRLSETPGAVSASERWSASDQQICDGAGPAG